MPKNRNVEDEEQNQKLMFSIKIKPNSRQNDKVQFTILKTEKILDYKFC